jgi:hypothetical protein
VDIVSGSAYMTCSLPQLAVGGEGPGASSITQAELAPIAAAAIARWEASGISAGERARLAAVSFSLADLEPGHLGDAGDAQVQIDRDAAGWGWFVDPTPADDAEFGDYVAATELHAVASSPAGKRMDLLTTTMHELGHILGRDDLPTAEHPHDLMAAELPLGARRLPAASAPVRAGISPARASDIVTADIGTLPAGKRVVITFDVTIASPLPGSVSKITSQATITGSNFADVLSDDPSQPGSADPTSILLGLRSIYLPMISASPAQQPLPDLIVDRIVATSSGIQVVIRNIGAAPVTEAFWVDLYINPRVAPTRVNQTWQTLGSQGMVWGVTPAGLPLAPGATLSLSIGDRFYQPALSSFSVPLPVGTKIYAQVDSSNVATTYGAVLETHERAGGPYNNISGPITLAVPLRPGAAPSIQAAPQDSNLPQRAK